MKKGNIKKDEVIIKKNDKKIQIKEEQKRLEKQKKKFKLKLVPTITAFILIIVVIIVTYFGVKDLKSFPTNKIKQNCNIETNEYKERRVFSITPKTGVTNEKVIIYFHGGGYLAEMTWKHWDFIDKLTNDTGSLIILIDYPLAPKYNCKDVFEVIEPLYKEITKKVNVENIIMMGDSAGGGLVLALEEKIGKEKLPQPSKTILISPWLDVTMKNPKMKEIQEYDNDLNIDNLKLAGIAYAGELDTNNYLISPINGDLSTLRNITILTGTYDILNPDVHILYEKAKDIGIEIEIKEYEKAQHIWIIQHNCDENLVKQGYQDLVKLVKEK